MAPEQNKSEIESVSIFVQIKDQLKDPIKNFRENGNLKDLMSNIGKIVNSSQTYKNFELIILAFVTDDLEPSDWKEGKTDGFNNEKIIEESVNLGIKPLDNYRGIRPQAYSCLMQLSELNRNGDSY